jgi:hypothetical protein
VGVRLKQAKCVSGALSFQDIKAGFTQLVGYRQKDERLVLHYQDGWAAGVHNS